MSNNWNELNAFTESQLTNQIWKDVEGYEGIYQISNLGRIRSLSRDYIDAAGHARHFEGKIRLPVKNPKNGYWAVILKKEGHAKGISIQQLVARHFIPNPKNKPQVNHKDQNKWNNRVSNLEWVTNDQNIHYGTAIARMIATKQASPKNIKTCYKWELGEGKKYIRIIAKYQSIKEASRANNIPSPNIIETCKGRRKTAGGYGWTTKEE